MNKTVKISRIKSNPNNPRIIKDDRFLKLVESIKSFPEMLHIRPIVVNKDMVILGGNMRFKACKEAELKEVPIIIAELTEDQEREFIIKDNISGGEWDWDILANTWNVDLLEQWGLDIPSFESTEPEDLSEKIKSQFKIEIVCHDEKEQELTYNKLIEEGYQCRLLSL